MHTLFKLGAEFRLQDSEVHKHQWTRFIDDTINSPHNECLLTRVEHQRD